MTKGLLITQEGIDAKDALDSQKVMDTRWKYLEILIEEIVTIKGIPNEVIYTHNLGFLPAFEGYNITQNKYIDVSDANGFAGIISDRSRLYYNLFIGSAGNPGDQILIRIFNLDITEEYSAPIVKTLPSKGSTPAKYGVKILRDNSDMDEDELSRFAMNTKSKALAIQKTGLATANSGTGFQAVIQHNLGYPPTYLVTFADIKRQWVACLNPDFVPALASSDGVNLIYRGAQSALVGTMAYIIFKEFTDFAI